MILAVDIGNTNIVISAVDGRKIVSEWRINTDTNKTADEFLAIIRSFFGAAGYLDTQFEDGIISSVVPLLTGPFINVLKSILGKKPFVLSTDVYDRLPVTIPDSAVHEIGTDLLCNAVSAWTKYKCATVVVDFGTALSFTITDSKGNIQGICIAPGIKTAVNSLFANTAQLPSVPLTAPENTLGKNTIHSIQAGIVLGYKGLVEGLIKQIKGDLFKECGENPQNVKIIATGGLNSVLKPITDVFTEIDKNITVNGLIEIYYILKENQ